MMRFITIAGVGAIALSVAAIAQVASTPEEQKPPQSNEWAANDTASNDMTDDIATNNASPTMGNDMAAPARPRKKPR